eukprot:gnl/TRDRNA2_/TRDRNA2_27603_c0_seq1.p1 gnl/TRDRNA2_/TRDRNA2_27603_c0~~gnl/TRDRNA2_/TRDRNA2_27603_c0_seq1.p1  ORF type:complete len:634 (+),score=81.08 gnl/TRDRNA2_/TRDRNA2_27603_c0_seq1:53-1954(+)
MFAETCGKIKATLLLALLVGAEAQKIQRDVLLGADPQGTFASTAAAASTGPAGTGANSLNVKAMVADAQHVDHMELVAKQLQSMMASQSSLKLGRHWAAAELEHARPAAGRRLAGRPAWAVSQHRLRHRLFRGVPRSEFNAHEQRPLRRHGSRMPWLPVIAGALLVTEDYASRRFPKRRPLAAASHRARGIVSMASSASSSSSSDPPMWLAVARFIIPTYALVATGMILSAVDRAFIGQVSTLQLAALGPATTIYDCSSYVLTFLNTATLVLLGSQPEKERRLIRSHALIFTIGSGFALSLLLIPFATVAVQRFGADSAMLPFAVIYLQIRALGAPIDRLGSVTTQFWLAEKDGIIPLVATVISALFNAAGDYVLCPLYGTTGAAVATVAASAISAGYLVRLLQKRDLWPDPFVWPSWKDFAPFAEFAGPVFLVLLMKVFVFATMTVAATILGTVTGAANQVLVSIFFIVGIGLAQPLSWAAQTFLPGKPAGPERREVVQTLLGAAVLCAGLGVAGAGAIMQFGIGWFTSDLAVQAQALSARPGLIAFVAFYIVFLALEGFVIALRQLRTCVLITLGLVVAGSSSLWALHGSGLLTLSSLWSSQAGMLAVASVASAITAVAGLRQSDGQPQTS